jgi:hypothetical protein
VFRDEEEILQSSADPVRFYDEIVAPYKGALEEWYVAHQGLKMYVLVIFVTAWVVLRPDSGIVWRAFPGLPEPPPELRRNRPPAA